MLWYPCKSKCQIVSVQRFNQVFCSALKVLTAKTTVSQVEHLEHLRTFRLSEGAVNVCIGTLVLCSVTSRTSRAAIAKSSAQSGACLLVRGGAMPQRSCYNVPRHLSGCLCFCVWRHCGSKHWTPSKQEQRRGQRLKFSKVRSFRETKEQTGSQWRAQIKGGVRGGWFIVERGATLS